jgi:hypothetical protein
MSVVSNKMAGRWAAHNEGREYPAYEGRKPRSHGYNTNVGYGDACFISYSTVVAEYHAMPRGKVVLITTAKWSNTTQRHIASARRHVTVPIFYVPEHQHPLHVRNIDYMRQAVHEAAADYVKRWKAQWGAASEGTWRYQLRATAERFNQYVKAMDIDEPAFRVEELIGEVEQARGVKRAAYEDPKAVAKRKRARARKLAAAALGWN